MIVKAFAVFDVKADTYSPPFFFPARGLAVRSFQATVADKSTTIGKYPQDFKLVELGEFDDQSGVMVATAMTSLGFGTDYVEKDERQLPLLKEVGNG